MSTTPFESRVVTGDLSIGEVAKLTSLSTKTIQRLARAGAFPNAYKAGVGGRTSPVRIPVQDVERWRALQPRPGS